MDIQEVIDREVALELCLYCQKHDQGDPCTVEQPCEAALVTAKTIRGIYHSQGVVKKVDRELPEIFKAFDDVGHNEDCHGKDTKLCPRCQLLKFLLAVDNAGYVAVESLI